MSTKYGGQTTNHGILVNNNQWMLFGSVERSFGHELFHSLGVGENYNAQPGNNYMAYPGNVFLTNVVTNAEWAQVNLQSKSSTPTLYPTAP